MIHHSEEVVRAAMDILSISIVVGTILNLLPAIAAGVSIIWGIIRIYETETVQKWLGNR